MRKNVEIVGFERVTFIPAAHPVRLITLVDCVTFLRI